MSYSKSARGYTPTDQNIPSKNCETTSKDLWTSCSTISNVHFLRMSWDHNVALMRYGEEWRYCRRICQEHFRKEAVKNYHSVISQKVHAMLDGLLQNPKDFEYHNKMCGTSNSSFLLFADCHNTGYLSPLQWRQCMDTMWNLLVILVLPMPIKVSLWVPRCWCRVQAWSISSPYWASSQRGFRVLLLIKLRRRWNDWPTRLYDSPWIGPTCAWCVISRVYSYPESLTSVPRERVTPFPPSFLIFLKRKIRLVCRHKKRRQSRILPILFTAVGIYIYGRFATLIEVN